VIERLAPLHGVEEISITTEEEYFPPPPELRELLTAVDQVVTWSLGGSVQERPRLNDRSLAASEVLEALA